MRVKTTTLFAASLFALWFHTAPAAAQYYPGEYRYGTRARLSPYLNLIRNNDANVDLGINYYLGTIPERERRYNDRMTNLRIRNIEQEIVAPPVPPELAGEIPAVPTAGKPAGSRTSASYFKQDSGLGNPGRGRRSFR
jgi:hypothetical protein